MNTQSGGNNIIQAIQWLNKGLTIRRHSWGQKINIRRHNIPKQISLDIAEPLRIFNQSGFIVELSVSDLLAEDWVVWSPKQDELRLEKLKNIKDACEQIDKFCKDISEYGYPIDAQIIRKMIGKILLEISE